MLTGPQCVIGQIQRFEQREGFLDDVAVAPGGPEQIVGHPFPLGDRQRHVFERAEAAEQCGDLESAGEPALDARRLRERSHLGAIDQDMPGIGLSAPGHQVDKAGLAGAVRADQRMARAAFEPEIDRVRHRAARRSSCRGCGSPAPGSSRA